MVWQEHKVINCPNLFGDKSQGARQGALNSFKNREIRVLVATDVAARGIDVEELSHVINCDLPNIPETYVHRIGRTGRVGMGGTALSFCNQQEIAFFKDIEKLIAKPIPIIKDHPYSLGNLTAQMSKDQVKKPNKPPAGKPQPKASSQRDDRRVKRGQGAQRGKVKNKPQR